MSILNHIDRHGPSVDLRAGLLRAANCIAYGHLALCKKGIKHTEFPAGITTWRSTGKLTEERLLGPCAMVMRHMNIPKLDMYTFEIDENYEGKYLFGDILHLDNDVKMFVFDPDENENVISDVLASSMHCMLLGEHSEAYAYLQFAYLLMSKVELNWKDRTEPERTNVVVLPLEL